MVTRQRTNSSSHHRGSSPPVGQAAMGEREGPQSLFSWPLQALLKATQVVVERLHVGEDAHGVRLAAHHHHILHFNEALTVGQILSHGEGQFKVLLPLCGTQGIVVEGIREE